MAKYTYADIIIDPNDPRISIGSKSLCFMGGGYLLFG